jgi:hypothetical protein
MLIKQKYLYLVKVKFEIYIGNSQVEIITEYKGIKTEFG